MLTLPDNGPRIRKALETEETDEAGWSEVEVRDCTGLDEAVAAGFRWASPDGVVLLSPAAPSFGQFRDYRDRGDAFARAVASLRPLSPGTRRAAGRAR